MFLPLINFLLIPFATESQEAFWCKGEIGSIIHGTWSFLYHVQKYKSTEGKKAECVVNMLDWDWETWILFLLCPTWPWANPFLYAFVQHGDSHTFSPIMLYFFQLWGLDLWRYIKVIYLDGLESKSWITSVDQGLSCLGRGLPIGLGKYSTWHPGRNTI